MNRRTFLSALTLGTLAAPLAGEAQQAGRLYRIGLIESGTQSPPLTNRGSLLLSERLQELGWVSGRDFVLEHRWYGDQQDRIPNLAAELIRTGVDVFVVEGFTDARGVQQVTRTIPIVTLRAGDIVKAGLAASLAKPGGNITGIQTLQADLAAKHLSLLKEAIPRFSRAGILLEGSYDAFLLEAGSGAKTLGIALQIVSIHGADELARAFSAFQAQRAQAVVVVRQAYLSLHAQTVVDLALKHRLPTISDNPGLAARGGLMSYGFSFRETTRSAADIVDKILRGAKVGEVPIQQATTFRLVVNMKTAKALGLTIPQSLLVRADEIIQ
jgi:putative ABC transport system substrate-binding protein